MHAGILGGDFTHNKVPLAGRNPLCAPVTTGVFQVHLLKVCGVESDAVAKPSPALQMPPPLAAPVGRRSDAEPRHQIRPLKCKQSLCMASSSLSPAKEKPETMCPGGGASHRLGPWEETWSRAPHHRPFWTCTLRWGWVQLLRFWAGGYCGTQNLS